MGTFDGEPIDEEVARKRVKKVKEAMLAFMDGDADTAADRLMEITEDAVIAEIFLDCTAMAFAASMAVRSMYDAQPGELGLIQLNGDEPTKGQAFAWRFVTAIANEDIDMAQALFGSVLEGTDAEKQEALSDVLIVTCKLIERAISQGKFSREALAYTLASEE